MQQSGNTKKVSQILDFMLKSFELRRLGDRISKSKLSGVKCVIVTVVNSQP